MNQPSARMPLPYFIVQGLDYSIECPLWRDGRLVRAVGGTVSIYDKAGRAVVDRADVDVVDNVARYTVPGVMTRELQRGTGWRVEWSLETDDGTQPIIVNEAALVRTELRPVITDEDIARRVSNLDLRRDRVAADRETWQPYIDEAWVQIQSRMLSSGVRPNTVISSSETREVHLLLTLALIYEDLALTRPDKYTEQATDRRRQAEAQWRAMQPLLDVDDDGQPDMRRPMVGTVWLMGGR